MVEVIQDFYKLSEKQVYKAGQKAEFDKETEKSLINSGLVVEVKKPTKTKSNKK